MPVEQSTFDKIIASYKGYGKDALAEVRSIIKAMKVRLDKINKAKGSEEAQEKKAQFMKDNNTNFKEGYEAGQKSKTKKRSGPSQGDIMGGKDGPKGPLGGEKNGGEKKKKRSMMGKSYNPRKSNRAGQRFGQR
tara:strand:- start:187 stop:588 length:402 start_codon:yes stop_codon:yes gene_type:complete